MRIYKTKTFRRFQRQEGVTDATLAEAVKRAEDGLIDADLGRGLIKQRVARQGAGRRGGFRSIIAYRVGSRAVFIYGFAKNDRDNISAADQQEMVITGALL
ncbi:MAG: type II toxin-antitoxin system RelE/ParE family toxin, partial [Hyphomicrobium sp.]